MMMALFITQSAHAADQPKTELEQAIQVVRQNFEIPAEFTDFTSSLSQYEGGQAWYLVWNRPDSTGGSFSAQVDANTGEITNMNKWQPQASGSSRVPVVSWNDARQTAAQLLQRLVPSRMGDLVMIEDQEPKPLSASGPVTYTINWRRVANQIPVEGIAAWVNIDANNGEVLGYSLNWSNLQLPAPQGIVDAEVARQGFIQNDIVKLEYQQPQQWKPLTSESEGRLLLAYIIDHPSNGAIDAFTGQPLIPPQDGWVTGMNEKSLGGMGAAQDSAGSIPLTPQEQEEIEKQSGLISREKAAAIILQWADVGQGMVLRSSSLDKDWSNPDIRIWSLSWSPQTGNEDYSQYVYGNVDARSGELLSFSIGLPQDKQATTGLSQDEALLLAEDFLRRIQDSRFAEFQLDPNAATGSIDTLPPVTEWPTWSFKFNRIHDGILFPANGADITVDRVHKQITSYRLDWDYSTLPPAAGVMGLEKANQAYLQAAPLTLTYAPYYSSASRTTEMRLVYLPKVPDGQPEFQMLDASSGSKLDYQGQPVTTAPTGHVFNDTAGNFAAQEIELLGKSGLMTEYGEAFHPSEAIKLADLMRAMLGIYQGPEMIRSLSDPDAIKQAMAQGWLKEEIPPESTVTRSLMTQVLIRSLGLEYLAEIPEIYQLPYRDATSIADNTKGYAALCWGLGIIRSDGVSFAPQQNITRAEAAAALVNSLRIKR